MTQLKIYSEISQKGRVPAYECNNIQQQEREKRLQQKFGKEKEEANNIKTSFSLTTPFSATSLKEKVRFLNKNCFIHLNVWTLSLFSVLFGKIGLDNETTFYIQLALLLGSTNIFFIFLFGCQILLVIWCFVYQGLLPHK